MILASDGRTILVSCKIILAHLSPSLIQYCKQQNSISGRTLLLYVLYYYYTKYKHIHGRIVLVSLVEPSLIPFLLPPLKHLALLC